MKKLSLAAVLAATLGLSACDQPATPVPVPLSEQQAQPQERQSGGLGMTYGGKLGVELAPGLVLGFDGSIGLGFGF